MMAFPALTLPQWVALAGRLADEGRSTLDLYDDEYWQLVVLMEPYMTGEARGWPEEFAGLRIVRLKGARPEVFAG